MIEEWKVICLDYPTEIRISEKRRAKYWKMGDKIPKKLRDDSIYKWAKDGFLLDAGGKKIIKNVKTAFMPRFMSLNSQGIYSGNTHHTVRTKIVNFLHNHFAKELRKQLPTQIKIGEDERLIMFLKHFGELAPRLNSDLDNFNFFYQKTIQDCLGRVKNKNETDGLTSHKLGIIEDDSLKYINSIASQFVDSTQKKLEVYLWKVSKDFELDKLMIKDDTK